MRERFKRQKSNNVDEQYCLKSDMHGPSELECIPSYDKVYVINLDKYTKRMHKMEKQLNKSHINYERFSAINGYQIKFTNLNTNEEFLGIDIKNKIARIEKSIIYKITCNPDASAPTKFNFLGSFNHLNVGMSAGEFGIWCSNKMIWDNAKEKGYNKIIILEDDVILKKNIFKQGLSDFINHLPKTFDLAYIDWIQLQGKQYPLTDNKYVNSFSNDSTGYGAWSTIFSSKAITQLLNQEYYTLPIDWYFLCTNTGIPIDALASFNDIEECKSLAGALEIYISSVNLIDIKIGSDSDPSTSNIADMGRL